LNLDESKYIEKKTYLSRYTHEGKVAMFEAEDRLSSHFSPDSLQSAKEELPKFVEFLRRRCGLEFRGRVLEIGATGSTRCMPGRLATCVSPSASATRSGAARR
jgi:hypothetical protein